MGKKEEEIWTWYDVELEIVNKIFGGIPKNPDVIEGFLRGKEVPVDAASKALARQIAEEVDTSIPGEEGEGAERAEAMWTGFKKDERGLYIETRQIKSLLKEAGGESELWRDAKGLLKRLGGAVFPKGEGGPDKTRIYLYRDGEPVTEPDGYEDGICHITDRMGRRSALKRKDYIEGCTISFALKVGGRTCTPKRLKYLFEFGEELGLGADRSCEKGKYALTKFEKLDAAPPEVPTPPTPPMAANVA